MFWRFESIVIEDHRQNEVQRHESKSPNHYVDVSKEGAHCNVARGEWRIACFLGLQTSLQALHSLAANEPAQVNEIVRS